MSDWIEHDGKKYFEEGYLQGANAAALRWDKTIAEDPKVGLKAERWRSRDRAVGSITICDKCGGVGQDKRGSACCRIPGHHKVCECLICQWMRASYENESRANATEAHAATLRAALESISSQGDYCPTTMAPGDTQDAADYAQWAQGEIARAALAATPEQSLSAITAPLEAKIAALEGAIERDRTIVADGVTALKKELDSRHWLTEGRGSYEWNDDKFREEFHAAGVALLSAMQPLVTLAADLSNSPRTTEAVMEARKSLDRIRAEAGRERAVRELRAEAAYFAEAGLPGSLRLNDRADEIAQEGHTDGR